MSFVGLETTKLTALVAGNAHYAGLLWQDGADILGRVWKFLTTRFVNSPSLVMSPFRLIIGITLLVLVLVHGLYRRWSYHPAIQGFVRGLGLAVAGVFVIVLTGIMNTAGWNSTNLIITLGAIVLGAMRRVPVLVVLVLAAIVGIALF